MSAVDDPLRIVAQDIVAELVRDALGDAWEDYADIGEHDWETICLMAMDLCPWPKRDLYDAAYAELAARADSDTGDGS